MFIDCAKLEKILKTDYKTWGVKFGLTKKGMYILNGTGWIIEADNTRITKEFLGTVIKTCGLAPEKGEFMTYQKGHDPQFETERKPLLWDMAEDTKEALISPIKIMQNDNMMTFLSSVELPITQFSPTSTLPLMNAPGRTSVPAPMIVGPRMVAVPYTLQLLWIHTCSSTSLYSSLSRLFPSSSTKSLISGSASHG